MLRIDVDHYAERPLLVCRLLLSGPFPFRVRVSSSGEGLHYVNEQLGTWDYRRFVFDDDMRIWLDSQRIRLNLPFTNLLWDVKNGKSAYSWFLINDGNDAIAFIDRLFNNLPLEKRVF